MSPVQHEITKGDVRLIEEGGRVHEIGAGSFVIGRGDAADIQLDGDGVSRRHARLVVGESGVTLVDLGSKNGVRLRGRSLSRMDGGRVELAAGESIVVGDLPVRVEMPGYRVAEALSEGGELTRTLPGLEGETQQPKAKGVVLPLIATGLFGLALVGLLLLG